MEINFKIGDVVEVKSTGYEYCSVFVGMRGRVLSTYNTGDLRTYLSTTYTGDRRNRNVLVLEFDFINPIHVYLEDVVPPVVLTKGFGLAVWV